MSLPALDQPVGPVTMVHRIVARRPIMGLDDQVVAFQLVPRATSANDALGRDGTEHTMTVSAVLGELTAEVDSLVGSVQLYCEAAPEVLAGTTVVTLPAGRTVLEVPAAAYADDGVATRCKKLRRAGYSIALDGFPGGPDADWLLEQVDVVRIDLEAASRDHVLALVTQCRRHPVTLLAARCLTESDLTWARDAGFELFSGPAVQRPVEVSGTTLAPSVLAQVKLTAELLDDRLDFSQVEEILRHEPALVLQVLQHASIGAGTGLRREVHSLREALVLMGTLRLRQWAALTVLGRLVSNGRTDALAVALIRARMCELLAPSWGIERGFAFTAGLLSALDLLLGVPISEVESRLEVAEALAAAAFRRETTLGSLVGLVADYQEAADAGRPARPELGDVELVAAMAFCWGMAHVTAIERSAATR